MPKNIGFSNIDRFSQPSAHTPATSFSARVNTSTQVTYSIGEEQLIPIQRAFRELTQEPLFKRTPINANADVAFQESQSVSWTMAKIGALFGAIYKTHVTTAEDQEKIKALSQEIISLKASLKKRKDLTPEEESYNNKCFSLANEAFRELNKLHHSLEKSYSIEKQWEAAIYPLTESTSMPLFPGESLLIAPDIKKGIKAAAKLQKKIDKLSPDSAARKSLEQVRDELAARFIEEYQEWDHALIRTIHKETHFLLEELAKAQTSGKSSDEQEVLQQLIALREQQRELASTLNRLARKKTKGMFPLQQLLLNSAGALHAETTSLDNILANQKGVDLPERLKYGSKAWQDLVAKRPVHESSFFKRMVEMWTFSPETWSDRKKAIVETLLMSMQLTQHVIGIHTKMELASTLQQRANQMMQEVPKETQEKIERSVGLLGVLLSDKYEDIYQNPIRVKTLTKGDPALGAALTQAFERFGELKPTRDQLFHVLDAFKMSQYAAQQSSPFSSLSLGEWWALFVSAEHDVEAVPLLQQEPPSPLDNYAVAANTTGCPLPLVSKIIGSVGKMLSFVKETVQEPSLSSFVSNKTRKGEQQLYAGMSNLTQKQMQVSEKSKSIAKELSREISLLQREVAKTLQNKPEGTCALSDLAIWEQEVSDKCYAVKMLEERIDSLMEQAEDSLSTKASSESELNTTPLLDKPSISPSSVLIFTSYTSDRADMCRDVVHNQKSYADANGYQYKNYEKNLAVEVDPLTQKTTTWEPYWSKIAGINQILKQEDGGPEWIVWLDDDAVITNSTIKIEDVITHYGKDKDVNFIVTEDSNYKLNTAVLIVRNCDWSREFFEKVWNMRKEKVPGKDYTYGNCENQVCLHEQEAIKDLLEKDGNDFTHVKIIPQRDGSDPAHGWGINTFYRWSHHDKKRKMDLYYDRVDSENKRWRPGDFIGQATGLATSGTALNEKSGESRNLRKLAIDNLIHAEEELTSTGITQSAQAVELLKRMTFYHAITNEAEKKIAQDIFTQLSPEEKNKLKQSLDSPENEDIKQTPTVRILINNLFTDEVDFITQSEQAIHLLKQLISYGKDISEQTQIKVAEGILKNLSSEEKSKLKMSLNLPENINIIKNSFAGKLLIDKLLEESDYSYITQSQQAIDLLRQLTFYDDAIWPETELTIAKGIFKSLSSKEKSKLKTSLDSAENKECIQTGVGNIVAKNLIYHEIRLKSVTQSEQAIQSLKKLISYGDSVSQSVATIIVNRILTQLSSEERSKLKQSLDLPENIEIIQTSYAGKLLINSLLPEFDHIHMMQSEQAISLLRQIVSYGGDDIISEETSNKVAEGILEKLSPEEKNKLKHSLNSPENMNIIKTSYVGKLLIDKLLKESDYSYITQSEQAVDLLRQLTFYEDAISAETELIIARDIVKSLSSEEKSKLKTSLDLPENKECTQTRVGSIVANNLIYHEIGLKSVTQSEQAVQSLKKLLSYGDSISESVETTVVNDIFTQLSSEERSKLQQSLGSPENIEIIKTSQAGKLLINKLLREFDYLYMMQSEQAVSLLRQILSYGDDTVSQGTSYKVANGIFEKLTPEEKSKLKQSLGSPENINIIKTSQAGKLLINKLLEESDYSYITQSKQAVDLLRQLTLYGDAISTEIEITIAKSIFTFLSSEEKSKLKISLDSPENKECKQSRVGDILADNLIYHEIGLKSVTQSEQAVQCLKKLMSYGDSISESVATPVANSIFTQLSSEERSKLKQSLESPENVDVMQTQAGIVLEKMLKNQFNGRVQF